MERIRMYIDEVDDEIHSACDYAEKYIIFRTKKPNWAKMYMEMAQEEMRHANNLYNIGQEFMDELSWVSDDDKMKWGRLGARMADKLALAKMMLTA